MPLIPVLLLFTYNHAKYVQRCAKNRAQAAFLCSPRLPWLEVAEKKNKMLPSLGVSACLHGHCDVQVWDPNQTAEQLPPVFWNQCTSQR